MDVSHYFQYGPLIQKISKKSFLVIAVLKNTGEEYLLAEEDSCSLFLNWKAKEGLVGLGTDRAHSMTGTH
jgi:hypothetical protein